MSSSVLCPLLRCPIAGWARKFQVALRKGAWYGHEALGVRVELPRGKREKMTTEGRAHKQEEG